MNLEMVSIFVVLVIGVLIFFLVRHFDRRSHVERERSGFDASWVLILLIFLCVIIAGILKNQGLI